MASTLLDPRVRKFKKFKEKEALNAINNAKKYIKSFIMIMKLTNIWSN